MFSMLVAAAAVLGSAAGRGDEPALTPVPAVPADVASPPAPPAAPPAERRAPASRPPDTLTALGTFGSKGAVRFVLHDRVSTGLSVTVQNLGREDFVLRKSDAWIATLRDGAKVAFDCRETKEKKLVVAPYHQRKLWLEAASEAKGEIAELAYRSNAQDLDVSIRDAFSPPEVHLEIPPVYPKGLDEIVLRGPFRIDLLLVIGADGRLEASFPAQPETPDQPRGRWLEAVEFAVNRWEFAPARAAGTPVRALLAQTFTLSTQKVVKRAFAVPLPDIEPRVGEYLRRTFPHHVVALPSVHGFVAAASRGVAGVHDIGATSYLVRLGEDPTGGSWIAVSSLTLFEKSTPRDCGWGYWSAQPDAAGDLMDLIAANLDLSAVRAEMLAPLADVPIPSGQLEPASAGAWRKTALRKMLHPVLENDMIFDARSTDDGTIGAGRLPTEAEVLPYVKPADPGGPIPVGGKVKPPELVRKVTPDYPEEARRARIEGQVILEAIIGTDGAVGETRVLQSIPMLDRYAEEAVGCWKYKPAIQNGRPVKVFFTVVVTFALK